MWVDGKLIYLHLFSLIEVLCQEFSPQFIPLRLLRKNAILETI